MKSHQKSIVGGVLTMWLACIPLGGCSSSTSSPAQPADVASDAQIKAIQNNPNIPQAQKDAVVARMKQQAQAASELPKSPPNAK